MTTRNAGDYACSWLFGDTKTGEIMILEIGLDHVSANRTNHGVYYGMNSAIDPLLRTAETTDQSLTDLKTSSGARNSRLHYLLLDKYYGRIDIPVGKKILADHYDPYLNRVEMGARSICAHTDLCPEGAHAYYPHGAIDCKLVDSTMARTLSFYAKWGPPCGRRFNATSFLKKHPEYKHFKPVLEDFPKREWTKITALS
jgi:hypothetical protein